MTMLVPLVYFLFCASLTLQLVITTVFAVLDVNCTSAAYEIPSPRGGGLIFCGCRH